MQHSKKYKKAVKSINTKKEYSLVNAIELLKKVDYVKFKTSLEAKINVSIDSSDSDQSIRFTTFLPHPTGRKKIILVFSGTEIDLKKYKTLEVIKGNDKTLDKIIENKLVPGKHFTAVIAEPSYMSKIAKIAKILGPRGLMPSPKTETIGNVKEILKKLDSGLVEVKNQPGNTVIHLVLGKLEDKTENLLENFNTVVEEINKHRPSKIKKSLISSIFVKSTMSPAIKIKV